MYEQMFTKSIESMMWLLLSMRESCEAAISRSTITTSDDGRRRTVLHLTIWSSLKLIRHRELLENPKKRNLRRFLFCFVFSKILDSFLGENHAILPYHTVTKVKRNVQKLLPAGFEPMTTSCGPHTNALDHCATKEVLKFGSKLISYSTPKIDQLWLLLKAKNGQDWFWPLF